MLIMTKRATKQELEEYYSLEDALKLSALSQMSADILDFKRREAEKQRKRQYRGQ